MSREYWTTINSERRLGWLLRHAPSPSADPGQQVLRVLAAAWQVPLAEMEVLQRLHTTPGLVLELAEVPVVLDGPYDGASYDPVRDRARLSKQHELVYLAMRHGHWRTLGELATVTGQPEASVSARLRDFRKPRYGRHLVERRHVAAGLWQYRVVWNENVPKPQLRLVPDEGGSGGGERQAD